MPEYQVYSFKILRKRREQTRKGRSFRHYGIQFIPCLYSFPPVDMESDVFEIMLDDFRMG